MANYWTQQRQDGKWESRREGAERPSGVFDTQKEAWDYSREKARESSGRSLPKRPQQPDPRKKHLWRRPVPAEGVAPTRPKGVCIMPATWRGGSGSQYMYMVFKLPHRPDSELTGNYVFAKQYSEDGPWHAVYVGQGKLQERYDAAIDEGCVTDNGATHYHYHTDHPLESDRREEESDIIAGNAECRPPNGCNERG